MSIQFSTVTSPGNVITSSALEAGARFWNTSGEVVVITEVGKWKLAGNSATLSVKVYSDFAVLLATGTIDMTGGTVGDFVWCTLNTPVNVPVGDRVYMLWQDASGLDQYYYSYGSNSANNQVITQEDIGFIDPGYFNPSTGALAVVGGTIFSSYTLGPTSFKYTAPVRTWTKSGTTYTTDGSYYQVSSAIKHASDGDTVMIPAGTYTWGEGGTQLKINKAITVAGAGQGVTTVNMHATATPSFSQTLISLGTGATLRDITFIGGTATPMPRASLLSTATATGWRVTNVTFTQRATQTGYFLYGQYTPSGLVDNCTITGGNGTSELIFTRGTADSWQTSHSMGGPDNIFIEDCTFNGIGYVNDANSNARHVVRNCTITGRIKVDGHGLASNGGPARGCRHLEVYRNTWTYGTVFNAAAIEIRGGGLRCWGNKTLNSVGSGSSSAAYLTLTDYAATSNSWPNFAYTFQTPADYPISDQIGVGMDPKAAASEPAYLWDNLAAATGNAGEATVDWTLTWKAIPQGAIDRYRVQTGNPSATFTMQDIIAADRDYFKHTQGATFTGASGVGIGTKTEMLAITPSLTGVGFWVEDEGSWDTTLPANTSGQLYVWDGAEWVLDYVPYTYPHPLRGIVAAPSITSATGNQTVDAGAVVVMTVIVVGNPSPTYQWRKGGVPIIGATSATLTLTYVSRLEEGSYDCVVTNVAGSATSTAATLTVNTVTDYTPPTPNPATFASVTVVSSRQITVVATTATDTESNPVEYNFSINNSWAGWQSSATKYFTELTPSTEYAFLCKSRDAIGNETDPSAESTATTNAPEPTSPANVLGNRGTRARRLGIF